MISLIVARDRNGAIGRNGKLPWHISEDLNFFRKETFDGALIMGRKTWESLPHKPLKNKLNIVVTSGKVSGISVKSVQEGINFAIDEGYERIYGIGGHSIYEEMLPLADKLLITEVNEIVENADTFFPEFDENDWEEINRTRLADSATLRILNRKNNESN
jgi:dihydrofolate reductase